MQTELLLKRENGDTFKISVSLWVDSNSFSYTISVHKRGKGKKKWLDVHDSNDYRWRALNQYDRKTAVLNKYLEFVTADEILAAKKQLWNLLNPENK